MPIRIYIYITALVLALILQLPAVARPEVDNDDEAAPLTPEPRQQTTQQAPEIPRDSVDQQSPFFENFKPLPTIPLPLPEAAERMTEFVDRLHNVIFERLLTTATWLDNFFADDRQAAERNQSYIRVRYDVFKERRTAVAYTPSIDVRLALPQLEKKAHVVISSAEPADTANNAPAPAASTRFGPPEDRKLTTALYYFLRNTLEESIIVRTGALFSHGKPVLFISPRYRWFTPSRGWDYRFTQEAIWRTDTRWQADTRFDIERQLPHELFFRTGAGGTWFETKKGYFYNVGCSLRQPLDLKHALEYQWLSSFVTRPVGELVEVMFSVRYRQSFWRDWLFFELAPQYRLPRDRQFNGTPGILFRFEMFFGKYV